MADLVVAGAGMAGLVAAARARELGADVLVHEKGDRPGGSMRLSGGFVWRYREWERFRAECPGGDPDLQRVVFDCLDEGLAWLERLGAPVLARETG
ncbi:MAG: FAD-dependent oxidoreductase, partial [Actinomycetota bacterium]|nr:FAD-dependent oxidoreductase [Actinomycetota bacterium]